MRLEDLTPFPSASISNFADLIAHIRDGSIYVNVHTIRNGGGGEIRGQLLLDGPS